MKILLKKFVKPIVSLFGLEKVTYTLFMKVCSWYYVMTSYFNNTFRHTARILIYHRIAVVDKDPHLLCVTPECFEEQIKWLSSHFDIISLPELHLRIVGKKIVGNEAVITLDDGYRDNLTNALPILEKYQVPATIFVTTAWLGQVAALPWDMEYSETDRAIFLTAEEIANLAQNPLITIGAHTHTHPRLGDLNAVEQASEIQNSKKILADITKQDIATFAYPFGGIFDTNATTRQLAKSSGYLLACATIPRLVTSSSPLFALPRFNIRNYSLTELSKMLYNHDS